MCDLRVHQLVVQDARLYGLRSLLHSLLHKHPARYLILSPAPSLGGRRRGPALVAEWARGAIVAARCVVEDADRSFTVVTERARVSIAAAALREENAALSGGHRRGARRGVARTRSRGAGYSPWRWVSSRAMSQKAGLFSRLSDGAMTACRASFMYRRAQDEQGAAGPWALCMLVSYLR